MSKREKNLVIASIGAILFALIYLPGQFSTKKNVVKNKTSDLTGFVASVIDKVNNDKSEGLDEFVVKRAIKKWENDPFLKSNFPGYKSDLQFEYKGYVKLGDTILGVINGVEYASGDLIEDKKAVIKSITTKRVVIVDKNKRKIVLPLEGEM